MGHVHRFVFFMVCLVGLLPSATVRAEDSQTPPAPDAQSRAIAPTYRVFATREGLVGHRTANGHIIQPRDRFVALPSWKALSSKGGNEFQVRVTYEGRSVILPVWDVGPWNTNDDYWSPDRKYSDLPVGMPMAQAARLDGYNGGRDMFGRRIRHPNGIDIADGAFWDDLGMTDSDWVEVTFLWLGADPGPPPPHAPADALERDKLPPDARVHEAAPQADGTVIIRWNGTDDSIGIAAYDIQARHLPDGEWIDWQIDTTKLEATFVAPAPGQWAFRARAHDWLGREQAWRDTPDLVYPPAP
jgi:hypothetical protein